MWSKDVLEGFEQAKKVRERAYAPYSQFLVGAAFKQKNSSDFITGCNVENASFGGTVCAERVALWKMVTEGVQGKDLEFLVLITDTPTESIGTPCGMCLQVMSEFLTEDFPVYIANLQGIQKKLLFRELLPVTFRLKS